MWAEKKPDSAKPDRVTHRLSTDELTMVCSAGPQCTADNLDIDALMTGN